jgi:ribosomal protein L16 Arg81 hydroxylase
MLQVEDEQIVRLLMERGVDEPSSLEEVGSMASNPYFQAGDWVAQRLKKLESLLEIQRSLSTLSARYGNVERRSNLSTNDFLENYYSANRPVVLVDLVRTWDAVSLWTPEYLKKKCGSEMVEVMMGRAKDPRYEINSHKHKSAIRFSEYVDMVLQAGETNDFYLVANNHFLEKEGVKLLYDDLYIFPQYLDHSQLAGRAYFWFGPHGTVTPLHHDLMNILLVQVFGRKRVTLIAPDQSPLVYNSEAVYSDVDCENPDYERYPDFRNVQKIEFILEPGEALFLPVGWWHHVRSLDVSTSVSFLNFRFPNEYHWNLPHMDRK